MEIYWKDTWNRLTVVFHLLITTPSILNFTLSSYLMCAQHGTEKAQILYNRIYFLWMFRLQIMLLVAAQESP